jgi:hypothetical protein
MAITDQAAEAVVTRVATGAQYAGSAGALIFGLRANEFAALCGVGIALAGFIVNWVYQHKRYKLAVQAMLTKAHDEEAP